MTKVEKIKIVEAKDSETIIENEIVVVATNLEEPVIKSIKHVVDMTGGKVQFITEGYTDGDNVSATVNGKTQEVEITQNFGIFCSGNSFTQYPVIKIND